MKSIVLFVFIYVFTIPAYCQHASASSLFSVDSLGACQGVGRINNRVYLYGDRETGIIREYEYKDGVLVYMNRECRFTIGKKNIINHPTGIAYYDGKAFIGNSVRDARNPQEWLATIYLVDWDKLLETQTLDKSLINTVADDMAIQGTRPEYIEYKGERFVVTSDYGNNGNEVRLYRYDLLQKASKTSESGILYDKFPCTPWVQNLHWIADKNILVLVQNQEEGRKWRLTLLDLEKSLETHKESIIQVIDFENRDELEGFCMLSDSKGIAVSSSRSNNVFIFDFDPAR
ncbi:hypothetical protein [Dysgonomonas termitidis]|uniref:Esterase-like activity of phytase family protein n=1 Tax=Dysgonomonas termitidis TaxID=1516126 RepID=A0ABV9KST4_9BACT